MLLVDALYVNNGGAKILLDYLILELNKSNSDVFYLLDDRITNKYSLIDSKNVKYMKANFFNRYLFYLKNKHLFSKVLCFGNLPPNIKMKAEVFTYFHQAIYLSIPKEFSFVEKLKFKIKIIILKNIAKNTNYWLVQTDFMKQRLNLKFNLKLENIKVIPFYPQFNPINNVIFKEKHTYFYVSNATPHKNHIVLINVFCKIYDKYKKGKLILTVNNSFPEILEILNIKIKMGYPIENIGFVDRYTLQQKYLLSEFLIFPSLTESFGLGLIEAIECGCKVLASDLPYVYEVCEPSSVFDPLNEKDIFMIFEKSLNNEILSPSVSKIENKISELICLLKIK